MPENNDLRIRLGQANTLQTFILITNEIKDKYESYNSGKLTWTCTTEINTQNLILPPWLCQPYVRTEPTEQIEQKLKICEKRQYEDADGNPISRKKMKKLRRIARRPEKPEGVMALKKNHLCSNCVNPMVRKTQLISKCFRFLVFRARNVLTSCVKSAAKTNVS